MKDKNIDQVTVKSFGDEWARHDQSDITNSELQKVFDQYFQYLTGMTLVILQKVLIWDVALEGGLILLPLKLSS